MFGLIARSSSRLLTQTRTVSRLAHTNPLSSLSGVHVSHRTLSSATEEPEEVSSLPDNRFEGVGQPFDKQIAGILSQPLDDAEVILERGGTLKVSEEYYKDTLNKAFGVGGWALVPCGEIKDLDLSESGEQKQFVTLIREYSLYCHERFVSQAFGETPFYTGKQYYSDATEKIKFSALTRCCKDLGIASELWNKRWSENWKSKFAHQEWVENTTNSRKSQLWKRKDEDWTWPYKKTTFQKSY
ncbi:uncharacterized protein LOC134815142 [Bolinopsis microptera]|uniref:uncharacterized protein LOC134815142 n=1 Tax=Bolinopsis microptera TaxID=2820187 RepID=UPI003079F3A8